MRQAHELDELEKLGGRVTKLHAAPEAPRRKLEARECIHGHGVGLDAAHVAGDEVTTCAEYRADAIAQTGKVGTGDRAADGEGDLVRPECGHLCRDRGDREFSSRHVELELPNAVDEASAESN